MKDFDELTRVANPAWPEVMEWMSGSESARIVETDVDQRRTTLLTMQQSVASVAGALAHHCGAVVVDGGWLTILGGGAEGIPPLHFADYPQPGSDMPLTGMCVGLDVLGGIFVVHGSGFDGAEPGEVVYWAPTSLAWEGLGVRHSGFVAAMLQGSTSRFYEDVRWPGWEVEVATVPPGSGLFGYPPPWSVEGQDLSAVTRGVVPLDEIHGFSFETAAAFGG